MNARYVQLIPSKIDELMEPHGFDARAIFVDLLGRVDWRTRRYPMTLAEYAAYLGTYRGRVKKALDELVASQLALTSFPRGHEGTVEIPVDVYEACVRMRTASSPHAQRMLNASRDSNKRPGALPHQTSDIEDSQISDPHYRLCRERDRWHVATGKSVNDDDVARCLTYCRTDCLKLGADHRLIIDETIGRVAEQIDKNPHGIIDFCSYVRVAVRKNAAERLGVAS